MSVHRCKRNGSCGSSRAAAALALALGFLWLGCRREARESGGTPVAERAQTRDDVTCIRRQEEGCVLCARRSAAPESDEERPHLCNPKDASDCVEFCTGVAAECAVPWSKAPGCLAETEEEFRRRLFWLEAAERPEAQLAGRVVDSESRKVEGAQVELADGATVVATTVTGKDGSFRIPLRAGSYSLRVKKSGLATLLEPIRLPFEKGSAQRTFRLDPEQRIGGRVVDLEGDPVPGAVVVALRPPGDAFPVAHAQSAADGTFTLHGLDARRYLLQVLAFGFRPVHVPRAQAPGSRVTLKLARTHVMRGRVLGPDGSPQPESRIVVVATGATTDNAVHVWLSAVDGTYGIDGFAPGVYLVWAQKDNRATYPPMRVSLEEEDPEPFELDLKLNYEGSLVQGLVVDQNGRPLAARRVELQPRWPLALPIPLSGETRPDGRFSIDGLTPGRYEIAIREGGRALPIVAGPREVQVPIEQGEQIDLESNVTVRREE